MKNDSPGGCLCCGCLRENLRPDGRWIDEWVNAPSDDSDVISAGFVVSVDRPAPTGNWVVDIEIKNGTPSLGTTFDVGALRVETVSIGGVLGYKLIALWHCVERTFPYVRWLRFIAVTSSRDGGLFTTEQRRHLVVELYESDPDSEDAIPVISRCAQLDPPDEGSEETSTAIEITAGDADIEVGEVRILDTAEDKSECPIVRCSDPGPCGSLDGPFKYLLSGARVVVEGNDVSWLNCDYEGDIYYNPFVGGPGGTVATDCSVSQRVEIDATNLNGTYQAELWEKNEFGQLITKLSPQETQEVVDRFLEGYICSEDLRRYSWRSPLVPFDVTLQVTNTAGCGYVFADPLFQTLVDQLFDGSLEWSAGSPHSLLSPFVRGVFGRLPIFDTEGGPPASGITGVAAAIIRENTGLWDPPIVGNVFWNRGDSFQIGQCDLITARHTQRGDEEVQNFVEANLPSSPFNYEYTYSWQNKIWTTRWEFDFVEL